MKSKLFVKFLLLMLATTLSIVILMAAGMQLLVYRNFTDYVVQQELDSLAELAQALSRQYQTGDGWDQFIRQPKRWPQILNSYFPATDPLPPHPAANDNFQRRSVVPDPVMPDDSRQPGQYHLPEIKYNREGLVRDRRPPPISPPRAPRLSQIAVRLSLFDADKRIIIGNSVLADQVFKPIEAGGRLVGWLGLKKPPKISSPTDLAFLKRQSRAFYIISAIVLVIAVFVSVLFSRHLTAPVRKIAEGTRAIRNRRFDNRITVTSNDELGQLAEDFNAMARTLQDHENIRRQWLSDIAHELRTPLAVLQGEIEALQDGIREMNSQAIDSLHSEAMVLSKIVNDLSVIARTESGIIEMGRMSVKPLTVMKDVLNRFQMRFDDCQMDVRTDFHGAESLKVTGDADKLAQVFGNIFENALRYAPGPGTLTVLFEKNAENIRISIEDTGPGVPEASLSRLFDRLYRTDAARSRENGGSGLGLSICKTIIEAHGGNIRAENSESGGLRMIMELPLC